MRPASVCSANRARASTKRGTWQRSYIKEKKMVKKGEWVRIHKIILEPSERAPQVPEDTRAVPLELWDKGFLLEAAVMGEEVTVETVTGRRESGTLIEVNPHYGHDFGKFIPELLAIDRQVREIVFGGEGQ
jgi:hypothetical protein